MLGALKPPKRVVSYASKQRASLGLSARNWAASERQRVRAPPYTYTAIPDVFIDLDFEGVKQHHIVCVGQEY